MKKILYIEDDPVSTIFVSKIIQKMGHEVVTANTSEAGLSKAYAERPDLILMDILLPGLDGFEMTMKMRSSETLKHTPIIAITGTSNPGDQQLASIAGCNGFVTKPIEYEPFSKYLSEFLDGGKSALETPPVTEEQNVELKRFTQRLVERLTEKIGELSHTNTELGKTNKALDRLVTEIRTNNADLMQVNFIANRVLAMPNRETIYRELPEMICQQLNVPSAAIYVVNEQELTLDAFWHYHFEPEAGSDRIGFSESPFFDVVYYQEPLLIDPVWQHAAEKADATIVRRIGPVTDAFKSQTVYFLPITGRSKGEREWDCQNFDCQAFQNKDASWWRKQITNLDRKDLDYEARLKHVSDFYFNCCLYNLKGVLAIAVPEGRLNETFRQILQSLVTTIGLRLDNIHLYEDVKEAYLVAEKQAITDGLTEIFNYRYFHHQLDREIKRAKRHWYKVSLIMIDVDHFKMYNDQNGHPAGDEVLHRLAEILKSTTRTSDIVARYGGEEFVIVLPETPKTSAIKLAEKIRSMVEDEKFPHEKNQPSGNLTVSLGIATFPDQAQNGDELIQRADEQLYTAKSQGRNRVASSQ